MRRLLSLVLLLVLFATTPAFSAEFEMSAPEYAAIVVNVPLAGAVRTFEQASAGSNEGDIIIETQNPDAPYLVVSSEQAVICVRVESSQQMDAALGDYVRSVNRTRPYVVEPFSVRHDAEVELNQLQTYAGVSEAWIVDARDNSGVLLVYRNPSQ